MLKLNEEAVSDLIRPEVEGLVRVAVPDGYGTYFLPRVLSRFAQAHPRIVLEIDCGLTDDIAAALSEGRLDVALVVRKPEDPRGEFLWAEPIDWVVSAKHEIHLEDPLPIAVFQHGCVMRARALKALDASGRKWRIAYCSVSLAAIQGAVLSGLAVGVIGHSAVLPDMRVLGPGDGFATLPKLEFE
ncbi:MAG: LysR substrate-binding domain-containing protein [Alphaproteobacteria bacterium]